MNLVHVDFEKYAIINGDIIYLIYMEDETVFVTSNIIYRNNIEINCFNIYCVVPIQAITINDENIYYKEFDRYIVPDSSASTVASTLYKYFNGM